MNEYIVWNPEKLGNYYSGDLDTNTYEALKEYEDTGEGCLSSHIVCSEEQLIQFIEAAYNETDQLLKAHKIS